MATDREGLKISLDSLGLTLIDTMPTSVWNGGEPSKVRNCAPESLQKSFVYVYENEDEDSGSIVVLGKSSLDAIQTDSLASFQQIQIKSMAMDCRSIISSLKPVEVEEKLEELLRENLKLRETLKRNSLAMKQHLNNLVSRQEELTKVHEAHRQKFTETKKLVNQLKLENNELRSKLRSEDEKIHEKRSEERSVQTKTEKPRAEGEVSLSTVNNEFAMEMLLLAEKSEEQAREIDNLRKVISSLNRRLESKNQNFVVGIQLENLDVSKLDTTKNTHLPKFFECCADYNDKLRALVDSYATQATRYTVIQKCLQRCSEIIAETENSSESSETSRNKELRDNRERLMNEELKIIVERQQTIQAQNDFQKMFTHFNSAVLELENLRQERSRFTSLQRGASLHDERLDEARAILKKREDELERRLRIVDEEKSKLAEMKTSLERERLRFEDEERKFIEANASINEEMIGLRETNDLLRQQCKIYQEDYADEIKLRENLIAEKNNLLDEFMKLQAGRSD